MEIADAAVAITAFMGTPPPVEQPQWVPDGSPVLGAAAYKGQQVQAMALHAPTPTITTVLDANAGAESVTWAANPSIAYWQGKLWIICDGNRSGGTVEGAAGTL